MASAQEIRVQVQEGNASVEKAQHYIRMAAEQLADARQTYINVKTDKLNEAVSITDRAIQSLDEALTVSFGVSATANAYAMTI